MNFGFTSVFLIVIFIDEMRMLRLISGKIRMLLERMQLWEIIIVFKTILLSPSGANAPGLPDTWFWRVWSVARRFYCLETSPKGSSLGRFPTLSKKKKTILDREPEKGVVLGLTVGLGFKRWVIRLSWKYKTAFDLSYQWTFPQWSNGVKLKKRNTISFL